MRRFVIVIEKAKGNYAAFVPDLPGCIATGATKADVRRNIKAAIKFHLEGMAEDATPIPEPTAGVEYVTVE